MSLFKRDAKPHEDSQVSRDSLTRLLLSCGAVAGPLFMGAAIGQGLTRTGFDLDHQPISFLSLGGLGWMQRTNFVLAGILTFAFAIGVGRMIGARPGGRLSSISLGGLGIGLIIAGAFAPDPGFGYPVGTPDGTPKHLTYHSTLHGLGFTLSFICFGLTCFAFAREAAKRGHRLSVLATAVATVVAVGLAVAPGNSTVAVRDLVAAAILWSWIGIQSLRLQSHLSGFERRAQLEREILRVQTG